MLKQHATIIQKAIFFLDLCVVTIAFFAAFYLRFQYRGSEYITESFWILPVLLVSWGWLLHAFGMYDSLRLKSIVDILDIIGKAGFFGFVLYGSLTYCFKIVHVSRTLILFMFALSMILLAAEKIMLL